MTKISANTWIPLSAAGILVGCGIWMGKITMSVDGNASEMAQHRAEHKEWFSDHVEYLKKIENRLGMIEGQLKRIRIGGCND